MQGGDNKGVVGVRNKRAQRVYFCACYLVLSLCRDLTNHRISALTRQSSCRHPSNVTIHQATEETIPTPPITIAMLATIAHF